MDGIRIEVTGNIARVAERPARITSGTVGLPVEFTFDSAWEGLTKTAVFWAGDITKTIIEPKAGDTVPWELLVKPGVWLSIGVYGENKDGSVVIPTTWANVCPIHVGVDPDGDPSTTPTPSIWQDMMNYIASLSTKPAARVDKVVLLASAWQGADNLHAQVVALEGITRYSQVDLKPSAEQLADFHEIDLAFATENDDGIVTVFAIGERPAKDYTIEVSITEVVV